MPEPTSSGVAVAAAFKAASGLAGGALLAPVCAGEQLTSLDQRIVLTGC